jgi:hypothetical protein
MGGGVMSASRRATISIACCRASVRRDVSTNATSLSRSFAITGVGFSSAAFAFVFVFASLSGWVAVLAGGVVTAVAASLLGVFALFLFLDFFFFFIFFLFVVATPLAAVEAVAVAAAAIDDPSVSSLSPSLFVCTVPSATRPFLRVAPPSPFLVSTPFSVAVATPPEDSSTSLAAAWSLVLSAASGDSCAYSGARLLGLLGVTR